MPDKDDFLQEYRNRLAQKPVCERLMDVHKPLLITILVMTEEDREVPVHQEYFRNENRHKWDGPVTDDMLLEIALGMALYTLRRCSSFIGI